MKTRKESKSWKAVLYALATQLEVIAQEIRYAAKPSDLMFPTTQLIQMAHRLEQFRTQWLQWWLGIGSERLKNWPKIWERFR